MVSLGCPIETVLPKNISQISTGKRDTFRIHESVALVLKKKHFPPASMYCSIILCCAALKNTNKLVFA